MNPAGEVVKFLLEKGADVNPVDISHKTPLYYACEGCHENTVKLLLNYGANVDIPDKFGNTPLHVAAMENCTNIVKLLLDHGANVNALDLLGLTPMHHIFIHKNVPDISGIKTLLKYGADVNAVDKLGMSVLFIAVYNFSTSYEIVKLLLENGAIPVFNEETNILASINEPGRYHIAELLIQYIILRKSASQEMFQVLDQFKTVLIKHFAEDSDNYKHLLRCADLCVNEIENMRNDYVGDKQTLFQFVSKNCLRTTSYDQGATLCEIDALIFILRSGKYIKYRDLIYDSIKPSVLIDKLCNLEVCYQVADSKIFSLNYACIDNLSMYMSKDDALNMIFVFSDKFNDEKNPNTHTSKRSAEENEESACKKPRQ